MPHSPTGPAMGTDYQIWSQYLAEWAEYRYASDIEDNAWADFSKGWCPHKSLDPGPHECDWKTEQPDGEDRG